MQGAERTRCFVQVQQRDPARASITVRALGRTADRARLASGYEITFGEAWSTPEQAALNATKQGSGKGISNSLHLDRLAIDLNLYRDGKWLSRSEDHRPLGEWWEKLHPQCRWGGRFNDGNHYSLTPDGKRA